MTKTALGEIGVLKDRAEKAEKALAAARKALKPLAELNLRSECEHGYVPGMFFVDDAEILAARAALKR